MNSPAYVWEKMFVAIGCMRGDGDVAERLEDATVSSLIRLDESDLTGELGDDLAYVLGWTKGNMVAGMLQTLPDELERKQLIEKMLHVMIETQRK